MKFFLFFVVNLVFALNINAQSPWVNDNAVWTYAWSWTTLYTDFGQEKVIKTGNVVKNGFLCDELVTYSYSSSSFNISTNTFIDSIIIDTNYTYKSITGDSVYYYQDSIFRLLYDFSAIPGDSLLIYVSNDTSLWCGGGDSTYISVINNGFIDINGQSYKEQYIQDITYASYWLGHQWVQQVNQRTGNVSGSLFPMKNPNCWDLNPNSLTFFNLLCFEDDSLFYDVNCNYFETISIEEIEQKTIVVTPNPFTSYLSIKNLDATTEAYLYDNIGNKLFSSKGIDIVNQDFSHLQNGIYWLVTENKLGILSHFKLIKN